MKKYEIVKYLYDIFKNYGFTRNGDELYLDNGIIIKKVKVCKSNYGNVYYIDYGYVLKNLELDISEMHIHNGLGSIIKEENERIKELLDFSILIDKKERMEELGSYIKKIILAEFSAINNENDINDYLLNRFTLNDISLTVKKYFNLLKNQ